MRATIKAIAFKSKRALWICAVAVTVLIAACQPASTPHAPAAQTSARKHTHATAYVIDAAKSTIVLRVYRDGPLARFGHNHVIAVTQLRGSVLRAPDILQSEVELSFPTAGLSVDMPADRAMAGADFPGVLTPEAIAGTRQHMLGPQLLAAADYPHIALRSVAISGHWPHLSMLVEISLRKFTSQLVLPVLMSEAENSLVADGAVTLSQVRLGLTPYSVLGGGLRVADNIDVQFHIVAVRKQ